jgi:AAA domain
MTFADDALHLGRFEESFAVWDRVLKATPDKAEMFMGCAKEVKGYIRHGLDEQIAIDQLYVLADDCGLTALIDEDGVRAIIEEALFAQPQAINDQADMDLSLGLWNAGQDRGPIPPRGWLLGNVFCRRFLSSLIASGGAGKTALRITQLIALAIGKALTKEHVFTRCRVLLLTLEDDLDEADRRITATCLHHGVDRRELDGWMFVSSPGARGGKLMQIDKLGRPVVSGLAARLEHEITANKLDLVCLDPFVKTHSVEENSNSLIDEVIQILADLASKHDVAIDAPHHLSKGTSDPGNAGRGRGASSMVDGMRLVYTLSVMTPEEANGYGISEAERRLLIRMDSGKVNITPPMSEAKWFRLVGVNLGNSSDVYPNGDEVQTVEPWSPPDTFAGMTNLMLNQILDNIEAGMSDGNRYSDAPNVLDRAAWRVIVKHCPGKPEGVAREIIKTWTKSGLLYREDYENLVTRKTVKGLRVDHGKRPS